MGAAEKHYIPDCSHRDCSRQFLRLRSQRQGDLPRDTGPGPPAVRGRRPSRAGVRAARAGIAESSCRCEPATATILIVAREKSEGLPCG